MYAVENLKILDVFLFESYGKRQEDKYSLSSHRTMIMPKKRVISCNEMAPDIHIIYINLNMLCIVKTKY